jgi:hypothetical protein
VQSRPAGARQTQIKLDGKTRRTLGRELVELLEEGRDVNDDTGADEADGARIDEAGGQEMERERRRDARRADGRDDGVAGVVATGAASADVSVGGEHVDELALALVAPLGAQHHGYFACEQSARGADV